MFPNYYCRKYKCEYKLLSSELECEDEIIKVVDEIPRFVESGSYASLFGEQWKEFKKTQLDSFSGIPISSNRLERCLGELNNKLSSKLVLEAGCGAGRFTELLLKKGAYVVSSDISSAVEVNRENCPISEHHIVLQADINDMPFKIDTFDIVICLGVIQHTANPDKTIKDLYDLVKPGGFLIFDHYTFNRSFWLRLAPLYRRKLRKLSSEQTIPIIRRLVKRYLPWHRRFAKSRFLTLLLNRISPVISYYRSFPDLNSQQQEEWSLLDTHDSLTDYYKHFRSKTQILNILKKIGAVNINCNYSEAAVEAKCQKPIK